MMASLFSFVLSLQNQLKLWHWQTDSFAQHKAFGDIYDSIDDTIDRFIEVYLGKFGKKSGSPEYQTKFYSLEHKEPTEVVQAYIDMLNQEIAEHIRESSEILNIKDEIVADLEKLKYLLTLQ